MEIENIVGYEIDNGFKKRIIRTMCEKEITNITTIINKIITIVKCNLVRYEVFYDIERSKNYIAFNFDVDEDYETYNDQLENLCEIIFDSFEMMAYTMGLFVNNQLKNIYYTHISSRYINDAKRDKKQMLLNILDDDLNILDEFKDKIIEEDDKYKKKKGDKIYKI